MSSTLRGSDQPLTERYDVALLDLDGVVYVGPDAVPDVPAALEQARQAGMRLAFVTNNAARTPQRVAEHLNQLGVSAETGEVITSAQAAARYLSDRLAPGAPVLVVGTTGVRAALQERGLAPVDDASGEVAAVVQGYSPEMSWKLLAEGAVAINRGVPWIATNVDPTVPSPRGPLPGNGSLVAALRLATRRDPVVTGKPDPTMHRETVLRTGAKHPIVIGDRLDTDIEGANAVGCDSLLVLSGVTAAADLLAAAPKLRPTYLGTDAAALLEGHPQPDTDAGGATCRGWHVEVRDATLWLRSTGSAGAKGGEPGEQDVLDALRALCAARWSAADAVSGADTEAHGSPAGVETAPTTRVRAEQGDTDAERVLTRLGLHRG